jgi:hypothetical protein
MSVDNADRVCIWTVNGIAVNPDGPVRTGSGSDALMLGTLRGMARRLLAEKRTDMVDAPSPPDDLSELSSLIASVREHEPDPRSKLIVNPGQVDAAYQEALKALLAVAEAERDALGRDLEAILGALMSREGSKTHVDFRGLADLYDHRFSTEADARNAVLEAARKHQARPRPRWITVGSTSAPIATVSIGPNSGRSPTRPEFDALKAEVESLKAANVILVGRIVDLERQIAELDSVLAKRIDEADDARDRLDELTREVHSMRRDQVRACEQTMRIPMADGSCREVTIDDWATAARKEPR